MGCIRLKLMNGCGRITCILLELTGVDDLPKLWTCVGGAVVLMGTFCLVVGENKRKSAETSAAEHIDSAVEFAPIAISCVVFLIMRPIYVCYR